ncbi:MAG TPA: SprT family zinc-dependent metalloprotease [Acidimicrobiales bacterium]
MAIISQPPEYQIRVSRRARHARLSVAYSGQLTVVIPERFARSRVPRLVEEHRSWIEQVRERFAAESALVTETPSVVRPDGLALRLTGELVPIDYQDAVGSSRALERSGRLIVTAEGFDEEAQRSAMKRYLSRRARSVLEPRLLARAEELGVSVPKVAIRAQQTRWGSCSAKGTISLNYYLVFLPAELVDYVLLHELCHRRQLNHSPRFWTLLERAEPDTDRLRAELKRAWHFVPAWLSA